MPKSKKKYSKDEEVAADYIVNFYRDVVQLTHEWANYENIMLELTTKHGEGSEGFPANERQVLLNQVQNVRYYLHKTFVEYSTMCKAMEKPFPKDLNVLYDKLKKQFIVNLDNIKDYVMKMNFALEEKVMQDLLKSSSKKIEDIYGPKHNESPAE